MIIIIGEVYSTFSNSNVANSGTSCETCPTRTNTPGDSSNR